MQKDQRIEKIKYPVKRSRFKICKMWNKNIFL